MVGPAASRRSSEWHPEIAVVVAITVESISAGSGIGREGAPGLLIRKQNRVHTGDGRKVRLIFPQRFATFRLGRAQKLCRSQPPDRPDIHGHDATGVRIETNVELSITRLGRSSRGRIEILIARNARCRRIRPTEASAATATAGTGQQFDRYMNAFASWR